MKKLFPFGALSGGETFRLAAKLFFAHERIALLGGKKKLFFLPFYLVETHVALLTSLTWRG
jgi:hypothetical protein